MLLFYFLSIPSLFRLCFAWNTHIYDNSGERVDSVFPFCTTNSSNRIPYGWLKWMTEITGKCAVIPPRSFSPSLWAEDVENVLWLLKRFNWTQLNWTELNWIRNKYNIVRILFSPKALLSLELNSQKHIAQAQAQAQANRANVCVCLVKYHFVQEYYNRKFIPEGSNEENGS